MQTILGAGGAIGSDLAKALKKYTNEIRLVSRNPQKVNDTDELMQADLTDREEVFKAIKDSSIAYITIGFPYKTKTWQQLWPAFIQNVIDACKANKTKLVFFDNIYMYDPDYMHHITEETPIKPMSKKGEVRAAIANLLLKEVADGKLEALIARAADFYGPGIKNSALLETVVVPLKTGKTANWLCSLDKVHSFTYTPDAAQATAILGNDEKAYGQVWHLPTASAPLTGKQWIEVFAKQLGVSPKSRVASKSIVKIIGLFNPIMREFHEMLYQYDRDYVFDSSKFENAYKYKPTTYEEGIEQVIAHS